MKTTRTKSRTRTQWCAALSVALALTVAAFAFGTASSSGAVPAAHSAGIATILHSRHVDRAELSALYREQTAIHQLSRNSTTLPACPPPPIPAATYPPGHSYGVPFLAAVTGGQILAGYSEWEANNTSWKDGTKTYPLYPWISKVFDITGWVTGLIDLPSLNATITPNDVVFCDQGGTSGLQSCVGASPPPGECIHIQLGPEPVPSQPPPKLSIITNVPPPGKICLGSFNYSHSKAGYLSCLPYLVTLTPSGNSSLTVTGVDPNGEIEVSVTTSAVTTVQLATVQPPLSCQNTKTQIILRTAVTSLPAGAPVTPTPPNPDLRGLQTPPVPLHGPLASGSATLGSNIFSVPAFPVAPTPSQPTCTFSSTVNDQLGGYSTAAPPANSIFESESPPPANAGMPGWTQFSATTSVVTLGFPVGPPPGFSF